MTKKKVVDGTWKLVGHVGVDSGLVWIGDPTYVMSRAGEAWFQTTAGRKFRSYEHFLEVLEKSKTDPTSFDFPPPARGREGLGVAAYTGSDGLFPVYGKVLSNGRIGALLVDYAKCFAALPPRVDELLAQARAAKKAGSRADKPSKLGEMVAVGTTLENADFWLDRSGLPVEKKAYLGVRVTRTDLLLPKFLYYYLHYLYNQGYWKGRACSGTAVREILVSFK